ncbi:MAG: hypothetical protein BJ554DRAFT_6885, partial [Olpidium bornovanus]
RGRRARRSPNTAAQVVRGELPDGRIPSRWAQHLRFDFKRMRAPHQRHSSDAVRDLGRVEAVGKDRQFEYAWIEPARFAAGGRIESAARCGRRLWAERVSGGAAGHAVECTAFLAKTVCDSYRALHDWPSLESFRREVEAVAEAFPNAKDDILAAVGNDSAHLQALSLFEDAAFDGETGAGGAQFHWADYPGASWKTPALESAELQASRGAAAALSGSSGRAAADFAAALRTLRNGAANKVYVGQHAGLLPLLVNAQLVAAAGDPASGRRLSELLAGGRERRRLRMRTCCDDVCSRLRGRLDRRAVHSHQNASKSWLQRQREAAGRQRALARRAAALDRGVRRREADGVRRGSDVAHRERAGRSGPLGAQRDRPAHHRDARGGTEGLGLPQNIQAARLRPGRQGGGRARRADGEAGRAAPGPPAGRGRPPAALQGRPPLRPAAAAERWGGRPAAFRRARPPLRGAPGAGVPQSLVALRVVFLPEGVQARRGRGQGENLPPVRQEGSHRNRHLVARTVRRRRASYSAAHGEGAAWRRVSGWPPRKKARFFAVLSSFSSSSSCGAGYRGRLRPVRELKRPCGTAELERPAPAANVAHASGRVRLLQATDHQRAEADPKGDRGSVRSCGERLFQLSACCPADRTEGNGHLAKRTRRRPARSRRGDGAPAAPEKNGSRRAVHRAQRPAPHPPPFQIRRDAEVHAGGRVQGRPRPPVRSHHTAAVRPPLASGAVRSHPSQPAADQDSVHGSAVDHPLRAGGTGVGHGHGRDPGRVRGHPRPHCRRQPRTGLGDQADDSRVQPHDRPVGGDVAEHDHAAAAGRRLAAPGGRRPARLEQRRAGRRRRVLFRHAPAGLRPPAPPRRDERPVRFGSRALVPEGIRPAARVGV